MVPFGPSSSCRLERQALSEFQLTMLDVVSDHHCPTAFELRQLEMIGLEASPPFPARPGPGAELRSSPA